MEFLKQLKQAFILGGTILAISLLQNLAVDFYGVAAAVSSFLILAIHDVGKKYIARTNQTAAVGHLFGMIVNPALAVVCVSSFFYVVVGEMVWYFWLVAFFLAFILFVIEAVELTGKVKKT